MKILHILSSDFNSGALSYTLNLIEAQKKENELLLVTDQSFEMNDVNSYVMPVSNRKYRTRIKNCRALRKILLAEKVTLVHAHSRAASWVAYYALKGLKIPLVSTIHGAQVKHSSFKNQDVYGTKIIAICANLVKQLTDEINIDATKISCIPNGIDVQLIKSLSLKEKPAKTHFLISIIGRFNGYKGEVIAQIIQCVLPDLLARNPHLLIQLIGSEWGKLPENGKLAFEKLHQKYPHQIKQLAFQDTIFEFIHSSDLVIGGGRVAIESLLMKTPVFAIGEAEMIGLISPENLQPAFGSNFGDIKSGVKKLELNHEECLIQLQSFIDKPLTVEASVSEALKIFYLSTVEKQVLEVYKSAIIQKLSNRSIPILMYHKVPDQEISSPHKIFVTKDKFKKQLLFFKWRGLKAITFKDYLAFRNGELHPSSFPKKPFILTFDDGYLCNYKNVLPVCESYGWKGVLFLVGDFELKHNNWDVNEQHESHNQLMNTQQKKAFVAAGWEIGAHTLTHPDLTKLDEVKLMEEIMVSKHVIETELNFKVLSFAYPFGGYNSREKQKVKEAGFEFGIATDSGGMRIEEDPFAVFRVNMFPNESLFSLYKKTSHWYRNYYFKKRGK